MLSLAARRTLARTSSPLLRRGYAEAAGGDGARIKLSLVLPHQVSCSSLDRIADMYR